MEPNKILSASILDLVFDDRNKEYGAYELRTTYPERIKKSLLITATVAALIFGGAVLASTFKPDEAARLAIKEVTLTELAQDIKEPEPLPEQKKPDPPKVQTEKLTQFTVVEDAKADEPPPTQDELVDSKIADFKQVGVVDEGLTEVKTLDKGTGIIEDNKAKESEGPFMTVEIDAKFSGNWEKFLMKNLNPGVPGENEAPAGKYKVLIQFVVDVDGNVSDIKALSNNGYGMEQEAIRVLKKATNWEPAIQNGRQVKAYRIQPITFLVNEE